MQTLLYIHVHSRQKLFQLPRLTLVQLKSKSNLGEKKVPVSISNDEDQSNDKHVEELFLIVCSIH